MTAAAILLSVIASAIYASKTGTTYLGFGMTVYVACFIAGLATASIFAVISGNRRSILGAIVLVANFGLSHYAWTTGDPVIVGAVIDLATACWFILAGQSRWELTIGAMLLLSVIVGALTALGMIPDSEQRGSDFIALAHPDLTSILGHAANIVLGFGAGDAGSRVRTAIRVRPRFALARERLMRLALAEQPPNDTDNQGQ